MPGNSSASRADAPRAGSAGSDGAGATTPAIANSNRYLTPTRIGQLIDEYDIRPSKALGQNFLADANHVRRICELADVSPGDRVIEIGPGLGSLTVGLTLAGTRVVAIEKDAKLAGVVSEVAPEVTVVTGDALTLDIESALPDDFEPPYKLVANLPYSVATMLLLDLLERAGGIESGVVMVQREVAERLVARPGSKRYGATSALVAYWASARIVGRVPPSVFIPRPSVESALVAFVRQPPPRCDRERLFELIRAGFAKRRKTLANSLAELAWRDRALAACETLGIDTSRRAETLTLEDFVAITATAGSST